LPPFLPPVPVVVVLEFESPDVVVLPLLLFPEAGLPSAVTVA
jgi:hypothetical protein